MSTIRYGSLLVALAIGCSACAGESAQTLATRLETAMKAGDMDAALALLDDRGLPGELKFFYMDLVPDCFEALKCAVTPGPLTDKFKQRVAAQAQQGVEVTPNPEGLLVIKEEGPKEHGSIELPYARVDGKYKVIAGRYTAGKAAELKARTVQAIVDAAFAARIQTMAGDFDTEWQKQATVLPAGGGDAGAAFVARENAMAAAAKANDVAAMIVAGGTNAEFLYRDKEFDGTPVSLHRRQLKMRAQAVRQLADVRVLGGFQQGDVAIITYEGHDGAGWIVRGYAVMQHKGSGWESMGSDSTSVPPG
jgi:hypothetical protein